MPALLRVCCGSITEFHRLLLSNSIAEWERLRILEAHFAQSRQKLNDSLQNFMLQAQQEILYKHIPNIRRAIHKQKAIKAKDWQAILPFLQPEILHSLHQYERIGQQIQAQQQLFEQLFEADCLNIREKLQYLSQQAALQNGLLLSSHSLYHRIHSYQKKHPQTFKKKELHTEISLIQYLSRLHTKSSPFSTFTALCDVKWNSAQLIHRRKVAFPQLIHNLRLNNRLFQRFQHLLRLYPRTYPHLHIRLNPTVDIQPAHYHFLTNSQNIESFQRFERNAVLDHCVELLSNQQMKFRELVDVLQEEVDASEDELTAFLLEVLDYGLFEWVDEVSALDTNWDVKLRQELASMGADAPQSIMRLLANLQQALTAYETASVAERKNILLKCQQQFHESIKALRDEVQIRETDELAFQHRYSLQADFPAEQLFFEDVRLDETVFASPSQIESLWRSFEHILRHLYPFRARQKEWEQMRRFHQEAFGGKDVPILQFYEAFYRAKSNEQASETHPIRHTQKQWTKKLALSVQQENPDLPHIIHLHPQQLEQASESLEMDIPKQVPSAFGAFWQLYEEEGELKAVVNAVFPGYGKMFSRFLHLFDEEMTEEIRAQHKALAGEDIWMENTDASVFNANLHPPLMPYELRSPQSENRLSAQSQIALTDILIRQEANRLQLIHQPSQKQIQSFDLGFQALRGRSELFKLISHFSPQSYLGFAPILQAVNGLYQQNRPINFYPRILFDQKLILQRKTWMIQSRALPFRLTTDSDARFWQRIERWRRELELPDEVFVCVHAKSLPKDKGEKQLLESLRKDDYKPQYIHFHNPILIRLLGKLLKRVPYALKIAEMLPASSDLMTWGDEQYVTEWAVESYFTSTSS